LELNEKNKNGDYPLLKAIFNDNTEVIKLLIDYAKKSPSHYFGIE